MFTQNAKYRKSGGSRYLTKDNVKDLSSLVSQIQFAPDEQSIVQIAKQIVYADSRNAKCEEHEKLICDLADFIMRETESGMIFRFSDMEFHAFNNGYYGDTHRWGNPPYASAALHIVLNRMVHAGYLKKITIVEERGCGRNRYHTGYEVV